MTDGSGVCEGKGDGKVSDVISSTYPRVIPEYPVGEGKTKRVQNVEKKEEWRGRDGERGKGT